MESSHRLKTERTTGKMYNILVFDFLNYKMNIFEHFEWKKMDKQNITQKVFAFKIGWSIFLIKIVFFLNTNVIKLGNYDY